jgi:hypothetical protein
MSAVLNITDLVAGDVAADYRSLPIVIRRSQSASAIVQFQFAISQRAGKAV